MVEMDQLGEDDAKVSEDPKWQALENDNKGVFVDGTMVDEMRYNKYAGVNDYVYIRKYNKVFTEKNEAGINEILHR